MDHLQWRAILAPVLLASSLGRAAYGDDTAAHRQVEVESGAVTFESATNVPGIEVKGTSHKLTASIDLSQDANGIVLQHVDATVPVMSLETGMKVRDEHMRKFIFTTADGQEPDLHFSTENAICRSSGGAKDINCRITGNLSVRGVSRPFNVNVRVKQQSGSLRAFRAECDGIVKLSDYGIPAPSQFGVKPANEVKIHLEFQARQKDVVDARAGGSH